jgi:hypothetical protein
LSGQQLAEGVMAQTPEGAEKIAAKKAGVTVQEYRDRRAAGLKRCIKCKGWKPATEYNVDRSRYDGRTARCCACVRQPTATGPSLRERAANRVAGRAWCAGCCGWVPLAGMRNGRCPDHARQQIRERYASDPAFRHAVKTRAYLRKRNVEAVPPVGETFLLALFDGKCAYCDTATADTWDHMVPVSKGGRTTPGNIVPACRPCNSSKGDSDLADWMQAKGYEPSDTLWDRIAFQHASLFG